jgi:hypothetical protein
VALAIKQILAEADHTPTLVFDEIDTGIGGRSAEPVGRSLWELARTHQVLCVTHLGQIAAYADAQFRIEKQVQRDGRTVTEVRRVEGAGAGRRAGPDARRRRGRGRGPSQRRGAAGAGRVVAADGRSRWWRATRASRPRPCPTPRPDSPDRGRDRDFLTYLRVERGLSEATLSAYRADLLDFAASRGRRRRCGTPRPRRRSTT